MRDRLNRTVNELRPSTFYVNIVCKRAWRTFRILEYIGYIKDISSLVMPKSRILEIGCGHGMFSVILSLLGYEIIGGDFLNCHWFDAKSFGATFLAFDGRFIPFEAKKFDALIMVGVLEHVGAQDEALVLKEASRVLKSGGILFIFELPHLTGLENFFNKLLRYFVTTGEDRYALGKNPVIHSRFYNRAEISALTQANGFVLNSIKVRHLLPRLGRGFVPSKIAYVYFILDSIISKVIPLGVFYHIIAVSDKNPAKLEFISQRHSSN